MLAKRTGALTSRQHQSPVPHDLAIKAGTLVPGIPHANHVARLYRQWLKLTVTCPTSILADLNDHTQLNERLMIIVRQKFREGAGERDPIRVRILMNDCERSLGMFRELAADGAKRKFPEGKPRINMHKMSFGELLGVDLRQKAKEYFNLYAKRKW
jgi:hypothetical protein